MKTLYLIGGTMGVGKTTVCRELKALLPKAVMLDGDWCWDMDPFVVNEETKAMVLSNIRHLLGNFLRCGAIENVVFCWVMHEQSIIDDVLRDLPECRVVSISLVCSEDALARRLAKDISTGLRQPDILARSAARLPLYQALDTEKLDTTDLSPAEAARRVAKKITPLSERQKRNDP